MVHFSELAHKGSLNNCIESNYAVYRSIYVKASFQSNPPETETKTVFYCFARSISVLPFQKCWGFQLRYWGTTESVSSTMTKVEIAKDIHLTWHLMWKTFYHCGMSAAWRVASQHHNSSTHKVSYEFIVQLHSPSKWQTINHKFFPRIHNISCFFLHTHCLIFCTVFFANIRAPCTRIINTWNESI